MFPNNGPWAAHNAIRSYIARVGLSGFPEAEQPTFERLLGLPLFEALTGGVETLYAAAREMVDMPDRTAALMALGEAAQAAAVAGLEGKGDRFWAIQAWALAETTAPGVENPLALPPDVEPAYSFAPAPAPDLGIETPPEAA